jgi:hypothetical protein
MTPEARSLLVRRGADDLEGELTKHAAQRVFEWGYEVIPTVGKRTVIRNWQEKEPMDWDADLPRMERDKCRSGGRDNAVPVQRIRADTQDAGRVQEATDGLTPNRSE